MEINYEIQWDTTGESHGSSHGKYEEMGQVILLKGKCKP